MLNQSVTFLGDAGFGLLGGGWGLGSLGAASCPIDKQFLAEAFVGCQCPSGYAKVEATSGGVYQWCQPTKADGSVDWASKSVGYADQLLGLTCKAFGWGCPKIIEGGSAGPISPYSEPWYTTTGGMMAMGLGALGVGALVYMSVKRK